MASSDDAEHSARSIDRLKRENVILQGESSGFMCVCDCWKVSAFLLKPEKTGKESIVFAIIMEIRIGRSAFTFLLESRRAHARPHRSSDNLHG
jgi:hypothetical protein